MVVSGATVIDGTGHPPVKGATVVIADIDPGSEGDFTALNTLTQRLGGTPVIVQVRPVLSDGRVRFVGEPIAAIISDRPDTAVEVVQGLPLRHDT